MKEITIRYNTYEEYLKNNYQFIQVLIDGKPIERLKFFSIEVDPYESENEYTIKQYMDFPSTDADYNGENYYNKK